MNRSKLLFDHLLNQMTQLKNKEITVEEAKEQANLARQANNTLNYELERVKTMERFPKQFTK